MPEPVQITVSNQQEFDELLSTVAEIAEAVHRIDHRTANMERELQAKFAAWSSGGLRGLRAAARGPSNGRA